MKDFVLPHHHGHEETVERLHRELCHGEGFASVAECFKQMSDPARVRIFWLLSHREECVINISAMLGMTSPAVSHHLRPMKECGILESRREGKEVYYRIAHREECELLHQVIERMLAIGCPLKEAKGGEPRVELAEEVHAYLLEHLDGRVTIEQLSHRFHVNPTTLKKLFKERYGDSLAAHMHGHRMERAAALLATTEESIGAVAARVGFSGQSRFTVSFRERFGVTPTEYRNRSRITNEK